MRRFLAGAAFSFFVLAMVLWWEGYQAMQRLQPGIGGVKVSLLFLGGTFSFIFGLFGARERHRRARRDKLIDHRDA